MQLTIFERVDSAGIVWYWTNRDDMWSDFIAAHPTDKVFATELALQCKDFGALLWERVK